MNSNKENINRARVLFYGLFASLFAFVLEEKRYNELEKKIEFFLQNPIDESMDKTLKNMSQIISSKGLKSIESEFDAIFYDLSGSPVPTTASFYEEERDDGKKRQLMVNYVLQSNYRRDNKKFTDLEDDIGFIFAIMQNLIVDELDGDEKAAFLESEVFKNVLNPFVDEFIENIYMNENALFYQEAAILLKSFISLERLFLNVNRPKEREKVSQKEQPVNISDVEAKRRLENKRKKSQEIQECIIEAGGDVEDEV
ncbi:MAG: molecular chaperone TorD family protein [Sulfurospirillum sp.]